MRNFRIETHKSLFRYPIRFEYRSLLMLNSSKKKVHNPKEKEVAKVNNEKVRPPSLRKQARLSRISTIMMRVMDRIQHAIIITPRAGTSMPPQEIEQSAEQKKSVADRKLITPPLPNRELAQKNVQSHKNQQTDPNKITRPLGPVFS